MIVSVEILYHFSCSACKGWWSVGDFEWASGKHITCPHCQHHEAIPDAILNENDQSTNLFEGVEQSRQAFQRLRHQRKLAASQPSIPQP